ncbi:ATP-binding cassette domain-containing protein [Paenibacillus tarimensis]|uniref:ATP-binding cassette domain-containing protein n=1 Tax=Paenibacillus tarimensis TaxID=416012 RepID=UPI001F1A7F34|nr:ABC transporter ATP-binding protein [Paenibacillus tarimensis]MCF2943443.1 ABC transporter ATP-binding protein [Paenibacillus tarimensis]
MTETAVRLSGVKLKRPNFQLGPINLEVPRGCVTAIVGPNGSGKSSTFRMILDVTKPDEGEIELLGERVEPGSSSDTALRQRIGYLQEESLSHERGFRASEKAAFVSQWYSGWDVNRYQELLRIFEIDPSLKLGKMSKGMRRKFDLAVVLAHNPELLILDEPSSGLDPLAWKQMIELLHRYMEAGYHTILLSTHIIEEVKRLADYIVFLVRGRVLGVYEKDELLSSWFVYFFTDRELAARADIQIESIPGKQSLERMTGMVKITTDKAVEAEDWLRQQGITAAGKQALELDDILELLVERQRLLTRHS